MTKKTSTPRKPESKPRTWRWKRSTSATATARRIWISGLYCRCPRLNRSASELAPDGVQPVLVPDELLARGAGAGVGHLGLLDPAPVVIVRGEDSAAFEKALEGGRAFATLRASGGHRRDDLVGYLVAVGTVGADRAARPAPRPADGVEAVGDPPAFVDELAAGERHVGDRRGRVADRGDDERCRDFVGLASAARRARVVELGPPDDDPLHPALAFDAQRLGEEIEDHALRLVLRKLGEAAKEADRFAQPGLERLVGFDGRKIRRVHDRHCSLEVPELAELLRRHRDLMRTAAAEDGDGADCRMVE